MDATEGYAIVFAVFAAYAAIVYGLWRAGRVGPDRAFSLLGPALMIRTRRGRSTLDRWGRFTRFWTRASDLGIALAAAAMVVIVVLLVFGAAASLRLNPATAPSLQEAVGLPGINPIIPLGYGIVALVVGIVLHEVFHGIVARSQRIGVKSLGILWFVVPIGAFVEQDDTEMAAAPRRTRDRVAAAGVFANFILALLFFLALSGLVAGSVHPNANGVAVVGVESGSPAANASLVAGDIITSINATPTTSVVAFQAAMANTTPHEIVAVAYYAAAAHQNLTTNVTLGQSPTVSTRGFLGVSVMFLTPSELRQTWVWPAGSTAGPLRGTLDWFFLPLATVEPVEGLTPSFFHLGGPFAALGTGGFWILANLLFWLAWMNLLLGLSNALPLVPLDGGLLFRDFASSIAARFRRGWSAARLDEFGGRAAVASSLIVLFLLVWQFVVPRLL